MTAAPTIPEPRTRPVPPRAPEVSGGAAPAAPAASAHVPRQLARPLPRPLPRVGRHARLTAKLLLTGLGMSLLAGLATWRAWQDVWSLADVNGDNSHVFLVPFVVAWLLWVRRGRVAHVRVTGRWAGPALIGLGWAIAAVGLAYNRAAAFHLGSLAVVVGAFVSVCGKGVLLRFMPVAFALLFVIPVPQVLRQWLATPLQGFTAVVTDGLLGAAGVESHVAGNSIIVNGKTVMIAEACNGMPMVFGLLLVTYAFAFAWPMRNWARWLLLILSPLVTLGCNVLRTTPLVWAYAERGREFADWLHVWSGWLMLPLAFVVLLGFVRLLRWFDLGVDRYRLAAQ